ncbi:MAG: FHA domain-containing protein [Acidobacteria bacterium]|nr:FHA domain-containing protein [Acidobacteriota bacterium]
MTPESLPRLVRFGLFELDLKTGELRKRGVRIALQDQPFQVLAILVARPGDLVTRDELRAALWADAVFVDFDHGLNKAVGKIRRALGDLAESPRFVETLERRGYRFIASVERVEAAGTSPSVGGRIASARLVRLVWNDRAIPLSSGTHFIGREPDSAIWIDSSVVSRRHARLFVDDIGLMLEDLGSHNGTFVNGERVEGLRRLLHGDEIRIGAAVIVVHDPPEHSATLTDPAG